jgi:hypothetical protein
MSLSVKDLCLCVELNAYQAGAVGTLDLAGFFGELVHAENVGAQIAALRKLHGAERAGERPLTRVFQAVRLQAVLLVKRLKIVVIYKK